jgi:RNA polymerase sigma-70 factor (ECF subfamily)
MEVNMKDQYDKVYRYCYHKIQNGHLAEDITQETFLRYFSQTTYINRGKPLAYLYTIAKNLCTDHFRGKQMDPLMEEDAVYEMKDIEQSIAVKQAVKLLSKDLQELILLRFVNELSIGEIGIITNLSRFALYRRINEALKRLKELIREEDFT